MSKPEGKGRFQEPINGASKDEVREIYEEFDEVRVTGGQSYSRLHPINGDGEPLCREITGGYGELKWSNPKPIEAFPIGGDGEPYRPFCDYCVLVWRGANE